MKRRTIIIAIITGICLLISACGGSDKTSKQNGSGSEGLFPVTLCLDWTPNTNHTGFYAALEKGYYEEAGLDVQIVQPPENGAVEACASGKVQFAIDAQDTLAPALASDTPISVTAVAALIQHNTSGIMSVKGEGMDTPSGLAGNTYLTWDNPVELAMMENVVTKDGGDWSRVSIIPNTVTDEAQDITHNPDHSIWVFEGWGRINADVNDIDTDFFLFKDINPVFDYYTPVLIANDSFLKENPEKARAFIDATRRGYEYAIENPEEAADILIKGDTTGSLIGSEDLVLASQKYLNEQYIADSADWGYIDPARWNTFYAWLFEKGLIEKELPEGSGFSNDFLK